MKVEGLQEGGSSGGGRCNIIQTLPVRHIPCTGTHPHGDGAHKPEPRCWTHWQGSAG